MSNKEPKLDEGIFSHRKVKTYCVVIYIIFLITTYTALIWNLVNYINNNPYMDAFIVFILVASLLFAPILLLLLIYPLYSLAYIADKNKQINEEQLIIEQLLARLVISEEKKETKE